MRLLVIEDEPDLAIVLAKGLLRQGYADTNDVGTWKDASPKKKKKIYHVNIWLPLTITK